VLTVSHIPKKKDCMLQKFAPHLGLLFSTLTLLNCSTVPETKADREALAASVTATIARAKAKDASLFFLKLEMAELDLHLVTDAVRSIKMAKQPGIAT
jgi:thiazole synthase ThiGH ThiG subunit